MAEYQITENLQVHESRGRREPGGTSGGRYYGPPKKLFVIYWNVSPPPPHKHTTASTLWKAAQPSGSTSLQAEGFTLEEVEGRQTLSLTFK